MEDDLPNTFADFFSDKVKNIVNECIIDNLVYNGTQKLNSVSENLIIVITSLIVKNCEDFDRILVRILIDGIVNGSIITFFQLNFSKKTIPSQWQISKVMLLFIKR